MTVALIAGLSINQSIRFYFTQKRP